MDWLNYLSFSDGGWGDELLSGLGVTLSLAVATLPVGLLLGLLVAAITIFGRPVPRAMAVTFTTTIRGLPELLTLFIIYHGVGIKPGKPMQNGFIERFNRSYRQAVLDLVTQKLAGALGLEGRLLLRRAHAGRPHRARLRSPLTAMVTAAEVSRGPCSDRDHDRGRRRPSGHRRGRGGRIGRGGGASSGGGRAGRPSAGHGPSRGRPLGAGAPPPAAHTGNAGAPPRAPAGG
mgnify:CR=1 FL=1